MNARDTRAGGKHLARERGADDQRAPEQDKLPLPARGTIADRLDLDSWMELARFLDSNVISLTQRYQVRI